MPNELLILIFEALAMYALVLWAHSLRHRIGLSFFYAILGGLTAVLSWLTDAGVAVHIGGVTFMVGSTVFYTAVLLGVFVVYVFDGPRATRIAIGTVAGVSVLVPLIAMAIRFQVELAGEALSIYVPQPSLRINAASVFATVTDLVFLAIAWEFLGKARVHVGLWLRGFLTLLGVMWLDVVLFSTGAFLGSSEYLGIMQGTALSRLFICLFASPLLYLYLRWQKHKTGVKLQDRSILAILKEVVEVRHELGLAQQEIQRRIEAEAEKEKVIAQLQETLAHIDRLEGLLPICTGCKKIRIESQDEAQPPQWQELVSFVDSRTKVEFSHVLCPDCLRTIYPDLDEKVLREIEQSPPPDAAGPLPEPQ
jgi:uncharacterized PurR-regulated membrane protein YhhQ (DUF165 family)